MQIKEISAKSILSTSQIYDYVINPYVGCQHGCSYCYARFMKRFTGHREPWGEFVDVKINAAELLRREIEKKKRGEVWVSGVCDPYQPVEEHYRLARGCLEILFEHDWPVTIQTRSPLVLRDLDLFKRAKYLNVGLSIPTANDEIRRIFEPHAPSIPERLRAIQALHRERIRTYVMIAPLLPEAEGLVKLVAEQVDYLIVDRMNYHYADWVYAKHGWKDLNSDHYFRIMGDKIAAECQQHGIDCQLVY